jgi:hypothetical protein
MSPFKRFIAKTVSIDGDYSQRIALAMDVLLIGVKKSAIGSF